MVDNTLLRLFGGVVLFVITGTLSALLLRNRDREAQRLFELSKLWGQIKADEKTELEKIRRRLVVGYSAFLVVSLIMLVVFLVKLLKTLGYI
jgi:hypothetical protein